MDVYEKRQQEQADRDTYSERASAMFPGVQIAVTANVQPMEDGAFVEATVWVPRILSVEEARKLLDMKVIVDPLKELSDASWEGNTPDRLPGA